MSILDIENARQLKTQGNRLGRDGLSQRVNKLVQDFVKENPDGHYKEAMELAGKLHAIYLATEKTDYWREIADRGFYKEKHDICFFEKLVDTM